MTNIFDTIVIGSGIAGITAGIQAQKGGKKVAIVSKNRASSAQSTQAQGGINATFDQKSTATFVQDTIKSSHGICDTKAIN